MLQILEGKYGSEELRSQIQHELDMAEEQINSLQDRRVHLQTMMQESSVSGQYLRPRAIRAVHGLEDLNKPSIERVASGSPGPFMLPESRAFPMPEISVVSKTQRKSQALARAMALVLERWMTGDIRMLASEWANVLNTASSLFQASPDLKNIMDTRVLMLRYATLSSHSALHGMSQGTSSAVRGYAFRLMRYILCADLLQHLSVHSASMSLFLSRSLSQEERYSFEREQALKLIRALMGCHQYASTYARALLSEGCVRALTAVAWEPEDVLYHASVETLAELGKFDHALILQLCITQPLLRALPAFFLYGALCVRHVLTWPYRW